MTKRTLSFVLFVTTLGISIWQLATGGNWWLIVILATLSGGLLIAILLPVFKRGFHIIKTLWRAWRYPDGFFYIRNLYMNLLPRPSEPGRGFEWICEFEVISILPWSKLMNLELEIREPSEIAGTRGHIRETIEKLSITKIGPHRFPLTSQAYSFIATKSNETCPFLPTRILIRGRNVKGRVLVNESIRYVVQW